LLKQRFLRKTRRSNGSRVTRGHNRIRRRRDIAATVSKKPKSARMFWEQFGPQRASGMPKYAQLRDCILAGIRSGFWAHGDRLPPEKALARVTRFSLGTVQKAYRDLVQDGTVQRRQGRGGSFVSREPKSVDTVWHFLFSDDRHERFLPVYPKIDRILRHRERGSWNLHLHWLEDEVVQIDRVMDIGHELLVFNQFFIDARMYDRARKGKSKPLEGVNLRRELNLKVTVMTYDLRVEEIPREICLKVGVPSRTIGLVVEISVSANPVRQGYFQRIFIPRTSRWLRIASRAIPHGAQADMKSRAGRSAAL
jgi:GntR family transcriptional regulator